MSSIWSMQDALGREGFLLVVLLVALAGSAAIGQLRRRGYGSGAAVVAALGFGLAVVVTVWLTLRPIVPAGQAPRVAILDPIEGAWGWNAIAWRPVVDNVALFVPLGVFATAAWPRRPLVVVWLACVALSVSIETLQYLIAMGRVANAADVLANAFGALVGILVAVVTRSRAGARRSALPRPRPPAVPAANR